MLWGKCAKCSPGMQSVYIGPEVRESIFGEKGEHCVSIPKFLTLIFPCHSDSYVMTTTGTCCFNDIFHFIFLKARRFMDSLKCSMAWDGTCSWTTYELRESATVGNICAALCGALSDCNFVYRLDFAILPTTTRILLPARPSLPHWPLHDWISPRRKPCN